jgi:hypothetical protein
LFKQTEKNFKIIRNFSEKILNPIIIRNNKINN